MPKGFTFVALFLGEYKSIMCIIHYMQKDYDRTLTDSSESLKMLSPEAKYCYNLSVVFNSMALLAQGKIDESVAVIENNKLICESRKKLFSI